ncbi:MAG: ABC transporter permease [Armatimonadota bacterium]|nr:ABC transporter permease [Armatimonadota bacterium]MDR7452228.1 ABC transporter permease [Armatimonadota bacterium]MDR7466677.1 ABC transporter permease [Armatimonadota bacterium]MDR7492849.1 ABC transporter permease [Armatimonadota bacterium]MDR7498625.1 ABC transporter permease [Armatimonadota bacterium]
MGAYLTRRMLLAVPTVFGVLLAVFLLIRLVPGDVVTQLVGLEATISPQRVEELRRLFGLDRPLLVQFTDYAGRVVRGDLGRSLRTGRSVGAELLARFPVTIELAACGVLVALLIGVPVGVLAAVHRGKAADYLATGFVMLGLSIPSFWLAILLILFFALRLGWLPPTAYVTPQESLGRNLQHMIMPALSVGMVLAAGIARIVRSSLLEVLGRHYIRTARAKGLAEGRVVLHHALRNALIPVVTVIGLQFGTLLGGTVIIEQIFSLPGVGRYALEGINLRDYPVIQGAVLAIALAFVLVNLVVDLCYGFLDPRIRYQ